MNQSTLNNLSVEELLRLANVSNDALLTLAKKVLDNQYLVIERERLGEGVEEVIYQDLQDIIFDAENDGYEKCIKKYNL